MQSYMCYVLCAMRYALCAMFYVLCFMFCMHVTQFMFLAVFLLQGYCKDTLLSMCNHLCECSKSHTMRYYVENISNIGAQPHPPKFVLEHECKIPLCEIPVGF